MRRARGEEARLRLRRDLGELGLERQGAGLDDGDDARRGGGSWIVRVLELGAARGLRVRLVRVRVRVRVSVSVGVGLGIGLVKP